MPHRFAVESGLRTQGLRAPRLAADCLDLLAEVQRLQAEVVAAGRAAQERVDDMESEMESEVNAAYDRGREEMRELAEATCAALRERPCSCSGSRPGRHHGPYCKGRQDGLDRAESAIRALQVQP